MTSNPQREVPADDATLLFKSPPDSTSKRQYDALNQEQEWKL